MLSEMEVSQMGIHQNQRKLVTINGKTAGLGYSYFRKPPELKGFRNGNRMRDKT